MDVMKMFPIMDQSTGLMLIALYAIGVLGLTSWFASGYNKTKESYLVANRNIGFFQGSISVGASWIWGGGLFVAASQAYLNGLTGLFWFCIGNFFALIIFSFAANKIANKYGDGFTISQWFREKYGIYAQSLILIQTILFALQGFNLNLFTASKSINLLTGLSPLLISLILVMIAVVYSWRGGLKAGIITDITKIAFIWGGVGLVAVFLFSKIGFEPALAGIGGKSGQGISLFDSPFAWGLFFGFGFPTAVGHIAMPWSDNANYQNAFAMTKSVVRRAFISAPFYWLILPIVGGLIGLSAAGLKYDVSGPNVGFINIIFMGNEVGWWLPLIYTTVVFASTVAIIDTMLLSSANLFANDVKDNIGFTNSNAIIWGKIGMVVLASVGIISVIVPGVDLTQLFVLGKMFSCALFIPILLGIILDNQTTQAGFVSGSLVSMLIGGPVFLYGQFFGGGPIIMSSGIAIQVLGGGIVCYVVSKFTK
jgi:Na+/proline symporter